MDEARPEGRIGHEFLGSVADEGRALRAHVAHRAHVADDGGVDNRRHVFDDGAVSGFRLS